jgi:hypothetical protein
MEAPGVPLESLVKFYSGLIGKKGQRSITIVQQPADYSADAYGRLITSSSRLERFSLSYGGCYCPKNPGLYKSGYTPETYENPKLFLNQTGDHLRCCYDSEGYYCLNNMHVGYPTSPFYHLLYANALINSRLLDFYYRAVSLEEGRANAQIDIDGVDGLPIRHIAFTTPADERTQRLEEGKRAVREWITDKRMAAPSYADFLASDLGRWLDERLPPLTTPPPRDCGLRIADCGTSGRPRTRPHHLTSEQSDVVHDLLAFLAGQMIALNREKQEEIRAFLTWLERQIGAKVDGLSSKTKVRTYHEHDFDTLSDVLRQNRRRLRTNPDVRAFQEDLERQFIASRASLAPLKACLSATDRLIDLLVYRLYGLTEEEVAVVEGTLLHDEQSYVII